MKPLSIFIFLALIQLQSFAQVDAKEMARHQKKVAKSADKKTGVASLDTFFYNGQPVCFYTANKSFMGNDTDFEFRSFSDNKKLIIGEMISEGTGENTIYYYDIVFLEASKKLRIKLSEKILDMLGKYEVVNDSEVNIANLNLLLLAKGEPTVNTTKTYRSNTSNNALVERNRNGLIIIGGEQISQGGVPIGKIVSSTINNNGLKTVYTISFLNDVLCATVINEAIMGHNWTIVTSKNNISSILNSSFGNDEKDIIQWLVANLYL